VRGAWCVVRRRGYVEFSRVGVRGEVCGARVGKVKILMDSVWKKCSGGDIFHHPWQPRAPSGRD